LAKKRQPDLTRRQLFAAAEAEFAAKGLAGARIDAIARRAGSNKRMLYQYFGNKEALWLKVLERAYEAMREEERLLDVGRLDPVEGMRRLVAFNIRYTSAHPEFVALLNNENLHQARYLRKSSKVPGLYSPLLAMIADLLKRGRRAGVFRSGIDPMQLYISIASLGYFYYSNIHTLSTIFDSDLRAPKARKLRERNVVDMVLGYLRP
jgi:AcrR family transcriptional regulator